MKLEQTLHSLKKLSEWADGVCLECGEVHTALAGVTVINACEACGCLAVIEAETLLSIYHKLKETDDD